MSEMPNPISIQGDVSGQIAIGNYINQFQNLSGCNINIMSPDQRPKWERQGKPVKIKPRRPETFLDRTSELKLIEASIGADKPLSVNGMPGIGKTTLLKQLAHLVSTDSFPDGILWFSAYNLKLEDTLQCLFSSFYNSNVPAKPDRAEIQKALQDVRALILIDDLQLTREETLILLDITPGSVFIIASTGQVLQGSAAAIHLGGLPEDDGLLLFEQELSRPLVESEKPWACEINRLLKGHPENIRWLAAKTREEGLALNEVAARLKDHSLESLFLESVQMLPQVEQQILAVLSAVEGRTLPQEHLVALLSSELIKQALEHLEARALVQSHSPAYSISETISGVLSSSWKASPWDEAVINYFVRWLEQKPPAARIAEIQDILLVLIRKALQRQMWAAVIVLGRALEPILILRGAWDAWNEILSSILRASTSLGDRALEGWALHQMGSRSLCLGSREEATQLLRRALRIRRSIGDRAGAALTEHNLSLITAVIPVERGGQAASSSNILLTTLIVVITTVGVLGAAAALLLYRPKPPILTSPANALIQTSSPGLAFEWQSVRGAATYKIQVDDQNDFTSPLLDRQTTTTRQPLSMDLQQGIYYWRVRSISRFNRAGNWSATRQFTISIPPGSFALIQPADQSMETKPEALVFNWERAENSAYYLLQLDDNSDFSSPVFDNKVPENNLALPTALSQGIYYWHVRAFNAFDTPGDWSATWSFTVSIAPSGVPGLIEPKDGSKLEATDRPAFAWQGLGDATQYEIQVDDNSSLDSPEVHVPVNETRFIPVRGMPQGVYYWRVRALNAFGTPGDWSALWSFTISHPPETPTLIHPEDGLIESSTTTPTFVWNTAENAARYKIQVSNDQNFGSLIYENEGTETRTAPLNALAMGDYYWRVRAFNSYDTPGDWSGVWRFSISTAPEAPILVAPFYNALLESANVPTFSWQSVPNAVKYHIQVDNDSTFASPAYDNIDSPTSITSTALPQGVYYWRVQAINRYETPGAWSSMWQFTISIRPAAPALLEPFNGSYADFATKVFFKWQAVANGAYYRIQVDNNSAFTSPEKDMTTPGANVEVGFGMTVSGKYYWRVRAFNIYNTPSDWSPSWVLTVYPPMTIPILYFPANNTLTNALEIDFSWFNVDSAGSYQIQIDDDINFGSPEIDKTITSTQIRVIRGVLITKRYTCEKDYLLPYFWRVRAKSPLGKDGGWSEVWAFTLKYWSGPC